MELFLPYWSEEGATAAAGKAESHGIPRFYA